MTHDIPEDDFIPPTAPGVQGIGWFVVRAKNSASLVTFYRDSLKLGDLRSRETSAMLWAGRSTVFEPNILKGDRHEVFKDVSETAFIPIFRSRDLEATFARLRVAGINVDAPVRADGEKRYFRDPEGSIFGLVPVGTADTETPVEHQGREALMHAALQAPAEDIVDLFILEMRTANPELVAKWYTETVGLSIHEHPARNSFRLALGDGTFLDIQAGGSPRDTTVKDREYVPQVPVFRVYGLDDLMERLSMAGTAQVQIVNLKGGLIWYGLDPDGTFVGFQERRMPDRVPENWTMRLIEDRVARRIWKAQHELQSG